MQKFAAGFSVLFVVLKSHMMASSYTPTNNTDSKDSKAAAYWLQTVLEDRAESALPRADTDDEVER
jgi:hypothetical protein